MYQDLKGKTAIVTGSSKGIGQAIALRFGKEEMNVVVNYKGDEDGAEKTVQAIQQHGGQAVKVHADVSKEEGIQAIMDTALEHFGTVDVFVNNSGFNGEEALPHEMTLEQWQNVIDVNMTGAFLGTKAALAYMMEHDIKGSILNISSVHQEIPRPFNVHYSASKGGMNMMTKTLALDYAEVGIRINAIAPGTMATKSNDDLQDEQKKQKQLEKIPMRTFGEPKEIGAAAAFLVSKEAAYITGTTLFVDGGMTLYPSQIND
ncbi:glucose 1-dehydrogenase [Bacillus safensis]|uniref:glucose 1-dehydrogenase n=1 Tax=Bacillus safensis TaxID=561879 RepID=UPI00203DF26F|nr:glucose 1-dehydrogenase [Bacillus safensis]MCM2990132.1 glucose 1-dehydrogenase [Bacillus safensis]